MYVGGRLVLGTEVVSVSSLNSASWGCYMEVFSCFTWKDPNSSSG